MRYRGTSYPILKTSKGYFSSCDDITQIKADMLSLLMTRPGDRVMETNYGVPLDRLNFMQPMEFLVEEARQMVASSIKNWEKRIQVTNVNVVFMERANLKPGYEINIQVAFVDPANMQEEHMLALQIPLEGGRYGG